MRIGVLSDTHIHLAEEISPEILKAFSNVDLIIHAGDFVGSDVFEGLKRLGEVKAVRGNVDSMKLKGFLPDKETLEIGGKRIGITHGSGGPEGIEHRVRAVFDDVDIIIYGHSHMAKMKEIGGVLLFNPGPGYRSFGILTVEDDVTGEIVRI
jgi:putative phosphoesterase